MHTSVYSHEGFVTTYSCAQEPDADANFVSGIISKINWGYLSQWCFKCKDVILIYVKDKLQLNKYLFIEIKFVCKWNWLSLIFRMLPLVDKWGGDFTLSAVPVSLVIVGASPFANQTSVSESFMAHWGNCIS